MMTAEEKRELLLKRALPGLAITIIYFVFVSGMMSEKMKKAETDYKTLFSSGVSKDGLPGAVSQQQQTQQQLAEVQKKVTDLQAQMKTVAGFLSHSGSSTNAAMAEVTSILEDYQVKLSKDEKSNFPEAQLGSALKEVWSAIKPPAATPATPTPNPAGATIAVHHLWLKASYNAMYQALSAIAEPKLKVLPITLTMHMPEVDTDNSGELEWELLLWM